MSKVHSSDHFLSIRANVEPFYAMDVLAKASQMVKNGENVDFLCVGQPAAAAPKYALEAARRFLKSGIISYTDASGHRDLRQRLAKMYAKRYGLNIDEERFFITTGSSAGFNLAFLSLFNPGDRVVIASPGYPAYRNILKALSLEAVEIQTKAENRWCISPQELEAVHREKPVQGILIASPANPTGTMMTPQALKVLLGRCHELGIRFISDEIYHGLTYPQDNHVEEACALQFDDRAIVINSFSKYYCMTGWRIGWMVLPKALVRPIERLAQSLYISAPELSQIAALHTLDGDDEMECVRQGYAKNRKLLLDRLPKLGFGEIMPIDGAFYAYVDASALTNDTMEFAYRILDEVKVAITPGKDFDTINGHRYMRFSFAGSHDTMISALDRLEKMLQ